MAGTYGDDKGHEFHMIGGQVKVESFVENRVPGGRNDLSSFLLENLSGRIDLQHSNKWF